MKKLFIWFLLSLPFSAAVFSQTSNDTVQYQLQPVTVTATRIAEPWIEIPLAVNVISVKGMLRGKGYGLDDALWGIPGVLAQSRYGNQDVRLTIRGYGSRGAGSRSNSGTTRGIRVLVDGFPETEPDGRTSFDLVDLSGAGTIEVVRSNASSVWGNASGGVVNVISNSQFDAPYISYQSSFGSFGFHKEMLQAGMMLGAGRFFLSLSNTNYKGWRYHSGSTQMLLNTGVITPLSEKTNLGVYLSGTSNLFRIPGPLAQNQFDSLAQQADSAFIKRDERRYNRLGRIGSTLTHNFDDANGISASVFIQTKYIQRSERNRFRDFNRYHTGGNFLYRNTSFFSATMKNTFMIGVDEAYQDGAILFYNLTSSGNRGTTVIANKAEGANNFGAFLQDELTLGEHASILFGGRYDAIKYTYDDFTNPKINDAKTFTHITPKAGFTYRITPTHSLYANLGGGVEAPAGNEVDPSSTFGTDTVTTLNPLLEPITSTTVEVGTKQILSLKNDTEQFGILMYDIALYWIEVKNDIIPYNGGAFYFTAGKTRRTGAELGGQLSFDNGLSLQTALSFSSNKYVEYTIDSVHYGAPGKIIDLKDLKQTGVPDYHYSAGFKYTPPTLHGVYGNFSLQGAGSYFADDRNLYKVPPYAVINVTLGVERLMLSNNRITLNGFVGVNNLTDKKYAASAWINPDLNANKKPVYLEPGLPRNYVAGVSAAYNF